MACGASASQAQGSCDSVCALVTTDAQVTCLEQRPCGEDLQAAERHCDIGTGGAGGGSAGGTGGGAAGGRADGAGGGATAGGMGTGGGGTNPCAIPNENLKVTFPHFNASIGTLVQVAGYPNPTCIRAGTGGNFRGYGYASMLDVIEPGSPYFEQLPPIIPNSFQARFNLQQREETSSEVAVLASETGVPASQLNHFDVVRSDLVDDAVIQGFTLPAGASVKFFLPTSTNSPGDITVTATSTTDLDAIVAAIDNGSTLHLNVGLFSGSNLYGYDVKLKPTFKTLAITPK
jgi:hypothetical protein